MQVAKSRYTSSSPIPSATAWIVLCWILHYKLGTHRRCNFLPQRTTAFDLFFFHFNLLLFRKTKEKREIRLEYVIAVRRIGFGQLDIHSCVIFAYIISRRDGKNDGGPCRRSPPPFSLGRGLAPKFAFLPFGTPATQAKEFKWVFSTV